MKSLSRWMTASLVAAAMLFATSVWAGDCCKDTAQAVKDGKACANCVEHKCCKETATKVAKNGEAKPCAKCAAKAPADKKDQTPKPS